MALAAVETTSAEVLGRALCQYLERYAFGLTIPELLRFISSLQVSFFIIMRSGDAAQANICLLRRLQSLVTTTLRVDVTIACHVLWWYERCFLHQIARAMATVSPTGPAATEPGP